MIELAPIVLFVYNRLDHTQKTIRALQNNNLAKDSDLYIYSDASAKTTEDDNIAEVRNYITTVGGFKSVTIIEQTQNQGLASSIITGVTVVVNKFGKVIVLEDDLVTSPYFLKFMNDALNVYENEEQVYSVSGCSYPVDLSEFTDETYFLRIPLCWGWATWKKEWKQFERNIDAPEKLSRSQINHLNFGNTHDFYKQAVMNYRGKLKTWFIFWYICSIVNDGLTIFPRESMVTNIGHDGSGENCGESNSFVNKTSSKQINVVLSKVEENRFVFEQHQLFFKSVKISLLKRVYNKVLKIVKFR